MVAHRNSKHGRRPHQRRPPKGLFEEEANHNLDAAIKAYQSVIDQTAEQRKFTATAVFRLGECYRKLNKTNEAVTEYQRVLREFPDVAPLATLSQQNLAGLGFNGPKDSGTTAATSYEAKEIEKIKAMVKFSPDLINAATPPSRMTPLGAAAFQGHLAVARFLLASKAEVNANSDNGYTPLHHAVEAGHKSMAELLLDHGADVNSIGGGKQPLHLAISKGYRSIIELLLSRKADVNAKDNQGRTPLHQTFFRHREFARMLLDLGADVNVQDNKGLAALHHAVSSSNWTQLILNYKPNLELTDKEGNTPLITAAGSRGDIESVRLLLKAGADVNAGSPNTTTPLKAAILPPDPNKVRLLLEHKADPNEKWPGNGSPLGEVLVRLRGGNLRTSDQTNLTEIADLLRQHGAKDLTVDMPSIGITRNGKELNPNYLKQDPQGLNHFTLFELLAYLYSGRGPREGSSIDHPPKFPDFNGLQITRPRGGKKNIKVPSLEEALLAGDCSKDVLLEWGDIVDIPEKDHKLSESWTVLPREIRETLSNCLQRKVNIMIKGETTELKLQPKFWANSGGRLVMYEPSSDGIPFLRLENVLQASKLLRASSDRTRVHVTRNVAGQARTFVFNLDAPTPPSGPRFPGDIEDLLLQNGDTIYVPDKT